MYLKVHRTPAGEIVALCDEELLGRVLSGKKLHLDLEAHSGFYMGKKVLQPEAVKALRGAQSINIVGKRSLAAAARAGFGTKKALLIAGVPHLQIYSIA